MLHRTVVIWFLVVGVGLRAQAPAEPFRTPGERPVDVHHVKLVLKVSLEEQQIAGTAFLEVTPFRNLTSLRLDAVGHEVRAIKVGDQSLRFDNSGKDLVIHFAPPISAGEKKTLAIDYQVRAPKAGLHF